MMFNLAGRDRKNSPMSPAPIAASVIGLDYFNQLNAAYADFYAKMSKTDDVGRQSDPFYVSADGLTVHREPSITSFLCTDAALSIYDVANSQFRANKLKYPDFKPPSVENSLANEQCLRDAKAFLSYAVEGNFRGSPHKL